MSLCIGAIIGWDSPSIVKLMAPDSPISVTVSNVSTLVAMVAIGHILGPIINQFIVDRIGRKKTILFSGILSIICWGLITFAMNIWVSKSIFMKCHAGRLTNISEYYFFGYKFMCEKFIPFYIKERELQLYIFVYTERTVLLNLKIN